MAKNRLYLLFLKRKGFPCFIAETKVDASFRLAEQVQIKSANTQNLNGKLNILSRYFINKALFSRLILLGVWSRHPRVLLPRRMVGGQRMRSHWLG